MDDRAPNHRSAHCPRCGYDLSGVAASWTEACPLEGVCSECGLAFAWRSVLNPRLTYPAWSFEHARRLLVLRLASTLVRALWPWRFWRRIRMEHPIRTERLAVIVVLVVLGGHGMIALAGSARFYDSMTRAQRRNLAALGAPPVMTTDEVQSHALRIAVWPYADTRTIVRRRGGLTMTWSTDPTVPARAWLGPLLASAVPLAYLLLPQTMRRTRVRRAHLFRIWAYSLVLVPPWMAAWIVLHPRVMPLGALPEMLVLGEVGIASVMNAALLAAAGVFWWCATTRYLLLPHGRSVAVVLTFLVGLAGATGLVVTGLVILRMGG